jgi:dihydrofolate reductase
MRKLSVFESLSLDGYFKKPDGDIEWTHHGGEDPDFAKFIAENATSGGELLFGRVTYEMMKAFWPTPEAAKQFPVVAKQMNEMTKFVVSSTLAHADWENTQIIRGDLVEQVRKLKKQAGPPITILGSGSIVAQLTEAKLIDEYQFVEIPIVLGAGKTPFDGIDHGFELQLFGSRPFLNGNVVLTYHPR